MDFGSCLTILQVEANNFFCYNKIKVFIYSLVAGWDIADEVDKVIFKDVSVGWHFGVH